jgi:hypothetical protein
MVETALFSGYKIQRTKGHMGKRKGQNRGAERREKKKKNGEENRKRTGKRTRQRRANFLPLFLLKEAEAFVPHDREARTREERPFSGFIEAGEGHRKREKKTERNKNREHEPNRKKNTEKRRKSKGATQRGGLALPLLSSLQTEKDPESKQIHSRPSSSTTTLSSVTDGLIPSVTEMKSVGKNNTDGLTDGTRPSV